MNMSIIGFTGDDHVPWVFRETKYGVGRVSIGEQTVKLVVTGNKTSAGIATADADIVQITSEDDADLYLGAGSECAIQCYAALRVPGVSLYAAPAAAASVGAVAASITITVGGTWSTAGTLIFACHDRTYQVSIGASDDTTAAALAIATALKSNARAPFVAVPAAAIVTCTVISTGARGNDYVIGYDGTLKPTGMTIVFAGGTPLHPNVVPFTSGAGTGESVANVVTLLKAAGRFQYQAWAQNDSSSVALVKAYLATEAGSIIKHTSHAIWAQTKLQATAVTLAQTTCNDARESVIWYLNGETHPLHIAAVLAAYRSVCVGSNPNTDYDGWVLPGVLPQRWVADIAQHATLKAALNSGLTPLVTNPDGTVSVCRAICSKSLNGTLADYRTYDWGDCDVPDRISEEVEAEWQVFKQSNPYIGPNPLPGTPLPPEGRGYPDLWNAVVMSKILKKAESLNWITEVDTHPSETEWNSANKCFMSAIPSVTCPIAHQLGASIRQTAMSQ